MFRARTFSILTKLLQTPGCVIWSSAEFFSLAIYTVSLGTFPKAFSVSFDSSLKADIFGQFSPVIDFVTSLCNMKLRSDYDSLILFSEVDSLANVSLFPDSTRTRKKTRLYRYVHFCNFAQLQPKKCWSWQK